MFREHLEPDAGMLFISEAPRHHVFWMKNTLIPLDMIFISADWRIAGIVQNAEPKTLSAREVAGISQYVLEIGGGLSARYGFRPGQLVDFQAGSKGRDVVKHCLRPLITGRVEHAQLTGRAGC